jgi:hypothetical protein
MSIINRNGRLQRGTVRRDGWTAARRATFLDVLAATGCVGEAERAAEMSRGCARKLRNRDARFGELWEEAMAAAYRRLEDELLAHALGRAVAPENPGAERSEPAPEHRRPFDPQLALAILKVRGRRDATGKRGVPPLSPAEVEAALMTKLGDLAVRLGVGRLETDRRGEA